MLLALNILVIFEFNPIVWTDNQLAYMKIESNLFFVDDGFFKHKVSELVEKVIDFVYIIFTDLSY
jgi:hypothetical protein